jgi:hypothetical protein
MLETKSIEHSIRIENGVAKKSYEVIYNAAEPDEYEDTWVGNFGSDPEVWLSYGFYDENIARYIADGIKCGKIKVKTYKDEP